MSGMPGDTLTSEHGSVRVPMTRPRSLPAVAACRTSTTRAMDLRPALPGLNGGSGD